MFSLACRLLLPLMCLSLLLCATIPAIGGRDYANIPDWNVFGFSACELPCWAGIMPGQTPFNQAYELLVQNVPALQSRVLVAGTEISFAAGSEAQYVYGTLFYRQGNVAGLRINVQFPLSQFVAALGLPDCVVYAPAASATSGSLTFYWDKDGVLIAGLILPGADAIHLTSPVQVLVLNAGTQVCDQPGMNSWIGFAPRWRYARTDRLN